MDAGSLAQMQTSAFNGPDGLPISNLGGLASRRGGQNIKPLSFETHKPGNDKDTGLATPRTSRSHLLAGLRTAPKSATTANFPSSPTTAAPSNNRFSRNPTTSASYGHEGVVNGPKTSLPRFPQAQTYGQPSVYGQQYTAEQILAPPEIQLDEQDASTLGAEYAELVATNMYLAAQKQRLQQQLMSVQAAQQQFQSMSIGNTPQALQSAGYQHLLYQQQQQQQQQMLASGLSTVNNVYAVVDPLTGQQTLYVGQGASQLNNHFVDQYNTNLQQLQQLQLIQQQLQQQQNVQHRQSSPAAAPRVHVSPPPSEIHSNTFRNQSPPRQLASTPEQHVPLPPPSANAFRRGHKKAISLVGSNLANINTGSATLSNEPPKSAGPKSTSFPAGVQTGTYGPGQGRAGEHPVRQPRGPPSFDELVRKPTAKDEGSKNFAARTRRSAVHNLMRAGITRRQVTVSGSSGSISPISETAEELPAALTDDESVSGRSGSGSLNGEDVECSLPSSRTSTGSWGAIGSERPGSREKSRNGAESPTSPEESASGSFASVFKSAAPNSETDSQRKPSMLVLTNAEKRRCAAV